MTRVFVAAGMMLIVIGSTEGCAESKAVPKSKFEQPVEYFEGVARNTKMGARLDLDGGSSITCIVETEKADNAWPSDVNLSRIRVEGYRIRSDGNDPNGIVIRCVNWTPANAPSKSEPGTKN